MDTKALYNLTYGVYLLSAQENGREENVWKHQSLQVGL